MEQVKYIHNPRVGNAYAEESVSKITPLISANTASMLPASIQHHNPLIDCGAVLLAVATQFKLYQFKLKIELLHRNLVHEITQFEKNLFRLGVEIEVVNRAKYIFCALLDEIIMNDQLAQENSSAPGLWSQQSLVSSFFPDAWGGEQFFSMLEIELTNKNKNEDLLELFLLSLDLGFKGRYRALDQGEEELMAWRWRVFEDLKARKPTPPSPDLRVKPVKARPRKKRLNSFYYLLMFIFTLLSFYFLLDSTLKKEFIQFSQSINMEV